MPEVKHSPEALPESRRRTTPQTVLDRDLRVEAELLKRAEELRREFPKGNMPASELWEFFEYAARVARLEGGAPLVAAIARRESSFDSPDAEDPVYRTTAASRIYELRRNNRGKLVSRLSRDPARGTMQLRNAAWKEGREELEKHGGVQFLPNERNHILANIVTGAVYFKQRLDAMGGDVALALASYNAGEAGFLGQLERGRVRRGETFRYVRAIHSYAAGFSSRASPGRQQQAFGELQLPSRPIEVELAAYSLDPELFGVSAAPPTPQKIASPKRALFSLGLFAEARPGPESIAEHLAELDPGKPGMSPRLRNLVHRVKGISTPVRF